MFSGRTNLASLVSSALTRLTLIYSAILVFVSLVFSVAFYQVSIREVEANFNTQIGILQRRPNFRQLVEDRDDWLDEQLDELDHSKDRVKSRLIAANLIVMGCSIMLSYILAKKTLEPIEEAHDSVVRFTADASHELRTPLASMQTEIEVALRDKKLSKTEAKNILQSNLEELKKLGALSSNLLKLARGSTYTPTITAAVDVEPIIESAVETVSARARVRGIKISTKLPDQRPKARVDADMIKEALVILLDNAVKYSPDKSSVRIDVSKRSKLVNIKISDEGKGIPADDIEHIFERFYRSNEARDDEGFGLGLSLAKQMVESNCGSISVKSKPGKGSVFSITLDA